MTSDVKQSPRDEGTERRVEVSEREAIAVTEAAREETSARPSFARELYLGRFAFDLINPHPRATAQGEAFRAILRDVCQEFDGARIERDAQIPNEYIARLAEIGAFGMKIPREYGGLGLSTSYYSRALMLAGSI